MNPKNKFIKLFREKVLFLELNNCLGCESQKFHIHSYKEGEFNYLALESLFKEKKINYTDLIWLKLCYLRKNL
jgi:hypothetical protein